MAVGAGIAAAVAAAGTIYSSYRSSKAQSAAASAQRKANEEAALQQQLSYFQELQQNQQTQNYYQQQADIQERELEATEQRNEMLSKETVTDEKRQTTSKNASDLTKGTAETAQVIKAGLKAVEEDEDLGDLWY